MLHKPSKTKVNKDIDKQKQLTSFRQRFNKGNCI